MPQLTIENLSLGYEGQAILSDVSFSVSAGDYLCIVGENGSGKSTLMKTILGLQKQIGGSITFGDGLNASEIGYLPQQTAAQKDFPATVWEIVLSGCQARAGLRPFYSRAEKQLAKENMEKNGISEDDFEMIIGNIITDKEVQDWAGYEKYDIVVANILHTVLEPLTPVIVNQMKPGGIYITSGIIAEKEDFVTDVIKKAGLELLEVTRDGEWVSVTAGKSR